MGCFSVAKGDDACISPRLIKPSSTTTLLVSSSPSPGRLSSYLSHGCKQLELGEHEEVEEEEKVCRHPSLSPLPPTLYSKFRHRFVRDAAMHSGPILGSVKLIDSYPDLRRSGPVDTTVLKSFSSYNSSLNLYFPLPTPLRLDDGLLSSQSASSSSSTSSTRQPGGGGGDSIRSSGAMPLPLPPDCVRRIRQFSLEEVAGACQNFSLQFWLRDGGAGPVYRAIIMDFSEGHKTEVAVTRLTNITSPLSRKKWKAEVTSLSRMSHPHLCRVIGFATEEQFDDAHVESERLLVYEHTDYGTLEGLLYGRRDKAPIDWSNRMKIALGAAQGLAYLHDRVPKQILYENFKTINIQVDQTLNAKLSDYGFSRAVNERSSKENNRAMGNPYTAPETGSFGCVTAKSNVWSFGVVLLELMTGRQNMDEMFPPQERNLVEWASPYLVDAKKLYLIMDPELKGRYSTKNAKVLADLAIQCVQKQPSNRPTMRQVVNILKLVTNVATSSSPSSLTIPYSSSSSSSSSFNTTNNSVSGDVASLRANLRKSKSLKLQIRPPHIGIPSPHISVPPTPTPIPSLSPTPSPVLASPSPKARSMH